MSNDIIGYALAAFLTSCCLVGLADPAVSAEKSRSFHGHAGYYHDKFYGRKTASGQILQKHQLTAAHRTLPFGTKVKVKNKHSQEECTVVINDRGPFCKKMVIDLSHAAAKQIGLLSRGTAAVACTVLDD